MFKSNLKADGQARLYFAFLAVAMLVASTDSFAKPAYNILDLGTLGGVTSFSDSGQTYGSVLNNLGQTVGSSIIGGTFPDTHAFRTEPHSPINSTDDLGAPGGESIAWGINGLGQVVGQGLFPDTLGGKDHAFRTQANSTITTASDMGTLGGTFSVAYGINNAGQVVGESYPANKIDVHAFRTAPNAPIVPANDLGTLGGPVSIAYGINNSGQVVGQSSLDRNDTIRHAFRTTSAGAIDAASDLGTLGGTNSGALAINDSGQAVGFSNMAGNVNTHAFRTGPNGTITAASDLGTLNGTQISYATAINSLGQVVGFSKFPGSGIDDWHAVFVDSADGSPMLDLNTLIPPNSGWTLIQAHGIDDLGEIAGYGRDPIDNQIHGFLLTPIPEPATMALLGFAAVACAGRRCIRTRR